MSKTSHYKANTKRGFEAGELAGLLASHSPNADYKVVISLRGKVRELIVTEDGSGREAVAGVLHDRDAAACLPPAPEMIPESRLPDDHPSQLGRPRYGTASEHGGKVEAAIRFPGLGETTIVQGKRYTRALNGALITSPADQRAPYVDGDAGRVLAKEVPSPGNCGCATDADLREAVGLPPRPLTAEELFRTEDD